MSTNNWIVVTGGAGLIGSNIVAELNRRGETDILVVDDLRHDERWKNLRGLSFADCWHKDRFREAFRNDAGLPSIRTVYHLGACSTTTETDANYLLDNNYLYTQELCKWALRNEVRFIYASSAATYGDGAKGYSDDDALTPELRPLNMYAMSKQLFDMWALRNGILSSVAGLKYFNVFGPGEDHKGDMCSVVNKAYRQIQEDGVVKLFKSYRTDYADGGQLRDFVYVKDAVDLTLFFGEPDAPSGLFNCGTGIARSWNDLVKSVFRAMNIEPQIEYINMPDHLRGKYQYFTQADTSKLRAAGYTRAFLTLENSVADYVQNYLEKQD